MKKIIEQNKRSVRAVIYKMLGKENPDLEQEAYIKIWQKLPSYQEQGKIKQWICTVTANVCRDYFRSKNFKASELEADIENDAQICAKEKHPEEVIDAKTRQKIILDAVDRLPKTYRDVIVLFEFEEYSLEKIAARLKIPVGTVKSRLHNGRKILKEKLSFLRQQGD